MFTKRHRWSTVAVALLALALLVPGAAWALGAGSQDGPAQTQPAKAAQAPQKRVPVIVQKADRSDRAEALVRSLGGAVTKDLSMINAFAAEIPAGALEQVAASPSVPRVAPDGEVESSATRTIAIAPTTAETKPLTQVAAPKNYFRDTLRISELGLTGKGIGVAVIDSGIDYHHDFSTGASTRVVYSESFNPKAAYYDALTPDVKATDIKTVDSELRVTADRLQRRRRPLRPRHARRRDRRRRRLALERPLHGSRPWRPPAQPEDRRRPGNGPRVRRGRGHAVGVRQQGQVQHPGREPFDQLRRRDLVSRERARRRL